MATTDAAARTVRGWPAEHTAAVRRIIDDLTDRQDFRTVRLAWSTGLLMAVRTA
ncbi:hypothetical protein [Kitasatospora sp. NPDC051914]|uniref:hypothetical protein n=1 Tax=Kitasatospora sp. NPDC051914 TaxID=3154945 RepID=UPI0034234360